MKIHPQGFNTIILSAIVIGIVIYALYYFCNVKIVNLILTIALSVLFLLIIWFFRVPNRKIQPDDKLVYAPADGKIVVIENVIETEYFNDERIQVSIFMSPLNVHANYYPVGGEICYLKYHPGKYLVAWHPKSSTLNERSTVVIKKQDGTEILVRQIAGIMARRIITNPVLNENVKQGDELGFIKFGSRVDVFLPKEAKINVELNQKSRAKRTILARFP